MTTCDDDKRPDVDENKSADAKTGDLQRRKRQAEALRANLMRRKSQKRGRATPHAPADDEPG